MFLGYRVRTQTNMDELINIHEMGLKTIDILFKLLGCVFLVGHKHDTFEFVGLLISENH